MSISIDLYVYNERLLRLAHPEKEGGGGGLIYACIHHTHNITGIQAHSITGIYVYICLNVYIDISI